jgi:hypothetical protein
MASCDYHKCEQCGGKAFYDANMSFDEDGGHWGAKIVALCRECAKYWEIVVVHVGAPVATNAGEESDAKTNSNNSNA